MMQVIFVNMNSGGKTNGQVVLDNCGSQKEKRRYFRKEKIAGSINDRLFYPDTITCVIYLLW